MFKALTHLYGMLLMSGFEPFFGKNEKYTINGIKNQGNMLQK